MPPRFPIVAQPGAATVSSITSGSGESNALERKRRLLPHRESHRVSGANQYKIFSGYTFDRRQAESLRKPEIAWCEQNCQGLWSIMYGPYVKGLGYEVRFGFTQQADAQAFARWREKHHAREEE